MRDTLAALGAGSIIIMGGVDAATLSETPIERVAFVADERVEAKQIENVVETTFPWKDQAGFKVSIDLGEPTIEERLKDKRNQEVITENVNTKAKEIDAELAQLEARKLELSTPIGTEDGEPVYEEEYYQIDQKIAERTRDRSIPDGFKVDILLNERPDTNKFCYQIEGAENYDFFYQPPLTQEEIAEGAYRPPEIEGSYAVYHKTLKNHQLGRENYATGKVMHIPRPQVWSLADDANKVWADMTYDEAEGLCVTVSQAFLDKAEYPVRVDPTFGYTASPNTGQTIGGGSANYESIRVGYTQTIPSGGTLDSLSAFLSTNVATNSAGYIFLNEKNGAGANSHSLVFAGSVTQISPYTKALYTATAAGESLINGVEYILSVSSQDPGGIGSAFTFFDSITGVENFMESFIDANQATAFSNSQESPWTATASGTGRVYGIYATFTCGEGSTCTHSYSTSGTFYWTAPEGVTSADVACWGGGGGGGDSNSAGGGGGGGGAFASSTVAVTPGTSYPVIVGAGGAQGSGSSGATGTTGGTSSFATTTVVAVGGSGGGGAVASDAVGGSGGLAASSTGDVKYSGGNGGAGRDAGSRDTGGGGGGAAGPNGNGGNGANAESTTGQGGGGGGGNGGASATSSVGGWSIFGGTGGNGGNATNGGGGGTSLFGGGGGGGGDNATSGGNGGSVGAGGGGGESNSSSGLGDGANGQCTITYTIASGGGGGTATTTDDGIIWF